MPAHRPRTVRPALLALLATVAASPALAQHAPRPRACTNTAAASLVTTQRSSPISAVFTDGPPTLWVLYTDRNAAGHDAVSLLEISGLASNSVSITTHAVGDGVASSGALSAVGGNVVAVFARPDHHVGIFVHPIAAGHDTSATIDSPHAPASVSVAAVRNRALVSWDDGTVLRFAWLDASGTPAGTSTEVTGSLGAPLSVSTWGGAALALDHSSGSARLAVVSASRRRASAVRSAAGAGDASAISAVVLGPRVLAMYARGGDVHLAQIASAAGAGSDASLGTAGNAETAVSAAPWGALGGWTDNGVLNVVPLSARGATLTSSFPVSHPENGERVHSPVLASTAALTIALWSATGLPGGSAVRMVRLNCQ